MQDQLEALAAKSKSREEEYAKVVEEKDLLKIQNDKLKQLLKDNNVAFEEEEGPASLSIVDEYKAKLKELED